MIRRPNYVQHTIVIECSYLEYIGQDRHKNRMDGLFLFLID